MAKRSLTWLKAQLCEARRRKRLVRVCRQALDYHGKYLEGFVIGVSDTLLALHRVADTIVLDGYHVLHMADITDVDAKFENRRFLEIALRRRRERPVAVKGLPLGEIASTLRFVNARYPLLTIFRERIYRDSCWIGKIEAMTEKTFLLREIDTTARWAEKTRYRLRDVTRIDFDGGYERALASVAPAAPTK